MTPNRSYYRIMAGAKSVYASECYQGGFIAANWSIDQDLSASLPESWRDYNHQFIPVYLQANPGKSKIAAGLACGMLHTVCKGMRQGDIVVCPNGAGQYYVGEVISDYYYVPAGSLSHRRRIRWFDQGIALDEMSQPLKNSTGSIGTVSDISKHAEELASLLAGKQPPTQIYGDAWVEDPTVFALEKHLEEFLVANWALTDLGKDFDIFTEEGDPVGRQYPSDTGPIDILATSKDGQTLLIVELKRGRASDTVVGQIQRYMGYVKDELAEPHQQVRGVIIALEDDLRLRRALSVTSNIEFYRYRVSFKLFKGEK